MICHVKQSFEAKNKFGERFKARCGDIVTPPDWVLHDPYFKALCDDGKITVHVDSKAVDAQIAQEAEKQPDKKKKG